MEFFLRRSPDDRVCIIYNMCPHTRPTEMSRLARLHTHGLRVVDERRTGRVNMSGRFQREPPLAVE